MGSGLSPTRGCPERNSDFVAGNFSEENAVSTTNYDIAFTFVGIGVYDTMIQRFTMSYTPMRCTSSGVHEEHRNGHSLRNKQIRQQRTATTIKDNASVLQCVIQ